jgi:plasmid stabilization system protein ParE
MRVTWSPEALDDVARIVDTLAAFDPTAVQDMAQRLFEAADGLLILPHRGCLLPDGRRALTLVRPDVIVYRVWGAEVRILAVWHRAQRRD